jgi:multiple sugar transport system substrate-binding protein
MDKRVLSRRELLRLGGGVAAALALAACAPPALEPSQAPAQPAETPTQAVAAPTEAPAAPIQASAATEPVKVQFMMWAWSPENEKFERDRVDKFNQSQQEVVVEPVIMPYGDLWTKLDILVASGQAPDTVWYDYAAYPLIAKGEFIDLKPYVDTVPEFLDDNVYDQIFWMPAKMLGDDRPYSLPIGGEGMNNFYNRDLLDAASEPYPDDSLTWDDFLKKAQNLTKREGDQVAQFGTSLAWLQSWWAWSMLLMSKGTDIVDSRTRPTKCTLDTPEAIESLQFLQDMIYKDKVAPDPAQASVLADQGGDFGSGKVALFIDGAWDVVSFRSIDRFKWDISLLPEGPKGRPSPFWIGGPMIAKQSKNPDAAWAWSKWTAGPDGEAMIATSGQQVTWLRKARDIPPDGAVPEHYADRFNTLKDIFPGDVWTAAWNQVQDKVWTPEFDKFWQGKVTAEELVATITPATTQLLQAG